MMETILIIEDDRALAQGLTRALSTEQTTVTCCGSLQEASNVMSINSFDLIILDVNLPDGNGFDYLKRIKDTYPAVPVIMLTANDLESDIVAGLEKGADDYITKPFSLAVLRARVDVQLRRKRDKDPLLSSRPVTVGDFSFDFDRMEYTRCGDPVILSRTEQKLLRILVENAGITISRDRLIDAVWTGDAEFVDENALSVAVKRLRDKLNAGDRIKTIYGIGYMWVKDNG